MYHQTGHHYKEKGDLKRAEHWYQKALKEKPTTDHHLFLGACLAKQGKYGEAKKHHLIASKNKDGKGSPDEAFFNLGLIYRAERNYKKAIECFENAIEIDPNYTKAKKAKADVSKIQYYLKKI